MKINSFLIESSLEQIDCSGNDCRVRRISFLSAVIARGEFELTKTAIRKVNHLGIDKTAIYEAVLQSYLFLGFPRMIEAGLAYNEIFGDFTDSEIFRKISDQESSKWFEDGSRLCRVVYGKNYDRLERKFLSVSPDIFRWMVVEGYGKVLSRPGLNHIERELAEVAALIVDRRERQLISHILGSLNVGAGIGLIRKVINDIRPLAGEEAYKMAVKVINDIESKNEEAK